MAKRRLIGTITSVKMHETALVTVHRMKTHPMYGKRYRMSKAYAVQNPENRFALNDVVSIEESRPLSKTKRWIVREKIGTDTEVALPTTQETVEAV